MITIRSAEEIDDIQIVQALWKDYWRELGLPDAFQGFQDELLGLPGKYGPPRGLLLLAELQGRSAGTIALRPLSTATAEMKRLYVRPEWRGRRIGRELLAFIIGQAREMGYQYLYGDTLPHMLVPLKIYSEFGFRCMDHPYSDDPTPGAVYLELKL